VKPDAPPAAAARSAEIWTALQSRLATG
jgi:hypothetical protein